MTRVQLWRFGLPCYGAQSCYSSGRVRSSYLMDASSSLSLNYQQNIESVVVFSLKYFKACVSLHSSAGSNILFQSELRSERKYGTFCKNVHIKNQFILMKLTAWALTRRVKTQQIIIFIFSWCHQSRWNSKNLRSSSYVLSSIWTSLFSSKPCFVPAFATNLVCARMDLLKWTLWM